MRARCSLVILSFCLTIQSIVLAGRAVCWLVVVVKLAVVVVAGKDIMVERSGLIWVEGEGRSARILRLVDDVNLWVTRPDVSSVCHA
jgi:hypothetical protein